MFDFVRKHNRLMQLLLVVLIFPSFVLFGLEGYNRFKEGGEVVAKVAGHEILQSDWDAAHKNEVDRLRQAMPNLDPQMLDSPAARYGTLERLVRERVLAAAAAEDHLSITDQRVAREISSNQVIASLRGPDGKLDMAQYRQLLSGQGMTPEMFEAQVRADLSARQVLGGLTGSAIASPAQAEAAMGALFERREIQVARFNAADYAAKVTPTDADLEAYYKAQPRHFQAPEQASVEYVVLDLDAVQKGITVAEQDLKTYYEQNAARLQGQEERRASHILVAAPKNAPAAEREKAKAKADELFAAVKKNPDSFAEVAKKNSQDPGSAQQGGDLDFFARGAMTKAFEDAVFGMNKGDIVGPVETEFGWHVIRLTDVKTPRQRTFEELRPQLEADLKKQQAQRKYAEAAETFSNTVYEQSDSLKPAADKLKLEVKTAANVARQPAPGAAGPLSNPKFLNALFAPDAVEKKRNTEAVEVGPSQLAAGRIVQYQPARTRPFAEVKDQVRTLWMAERAAELARKDGQEKLNAWKAQPAGAAVGEPVVVSRQDPQKLQRPVVEAALRADPAALPAWAGVDLGAQGYAVVKVNKVLPREAPTPDAAKQELEQYKRAWSAAESMAYYQLLKDRFKAQIKVAKPADSAAVPQGQ
jgi:peptidyl-prolyl cis-trans isomerase D